MQSTSTGTKHPRTSASDYTVPPSKMMKMEKVAVGEEGQSSKNHSEMQGPAANNSHNYTLRRNSRSRYRPATGGNALLDELLCAGKKPTTRTAEIPDFIGQVNDDEFGRCQLTNGRRVFNFSYNIATVELSSSFLPVYSYHQYNIALSGPRQLANTIS